MSTYCIFQLCSFLPLPFLSKILCDRSFSLQHVDSSGSPLSPKQLCYFEDKLSLCKPSSVFCAKVQWDLYSNVFVMMRSPQTSVIVFTSQFGSFLECVLFSTVPTPQMFSCLESTVCLEQTHLVMDKFLNVSVLRHSILLFLI